MTTGRQPEGGPGTRPADAGAVPDRSGEVEPTVCPRCGESQELAKVKGCIRCLRCGFKFDCNGW